MATGKMRVSLVNTLVGDQRRELLRYAANCAERNTGALSSFRANLVYRDRVYQRSLDVTDEQVRAINANLSGDARKIQNMAVPIVMPQVESAVAYQAGVYLTSSPIFGVVSYPANMSAALQFETAIGQQAKRYGWTRELLKIFRNGYKYNFGPAVVTWENTPVRKVVTSTDPSATAGTAKIDTFSYGANCIKAVDPYNCFMDMTVNPADMHTKGEFFGYNEIVSRVELMRLIEGLAADKLENQKKVFNTAYSGITNTDISGRHYYVPVINRLTNAASMQSGGLTGTNWGQWAGLTSRKRGDVHYKENYLITRFFCRALPSDFGAVGDSPRVYYCVIVNWQEVIYVEEMNSAHDFLPAFVMQPNEDGLGYQTQSMVDNAAPYQDMSSALWNATIESKRRQIFDRLIYNPRYIDKKDIDVASASARIALRNANIGKDDNVMARAIYQVPYRDDNAGTNLQMSEMISGLADQATGQNKVDRGQFQPGNKTRTEFSTTMTNSNSRQQLSSLSIQEQFMTPVKETIKANTLQNQQAGTILNQDKKQEVNVDPVQMRQAILEFQMTDGMLPADKILNPELLMVFLQTAQAIPAMSTEYDIMGMFMYWAKLQGAVWLDDFKRDANAQQQFLQTVRQTTAAQQPPAIPTPAAA